MNPFSLYFLAIVDSLNITLMIASIFCGFALILPFVYFLFKEDEGVEDSWPATLKLMGHMRYRLLVILFIILVVLGTLVPPKDALLSIIETLK